MTELDYSVKAVARHIHISPQKVRLVIDQVRGKGVEEALALLRFMPNRAAPQVAKLIGSAAANAEDRYGLGPDELYVALISADDGPRMRRFRIGGRGRIKPRIKRSAHINVVLGFR